METGNEMRWNATGNPSLIDLDDGDTLPGLSSALRLLVMGLPQVLGTHSERLMQSVALPKLSIMDHL